jgi:hypothetical protein
MTKKSRTILFVICVFLFLLICPLAILYSQGYRIALNPNDGGVKISQTGGLFVKAYPKQVEVQIDEIKPLKHPLKEKTDFFFGSLLVENLFPKKYKVEVKKEGYLTWQKILEVKEKEVTEIKNIILFPQNKEFSIFASDLKDFWFSPDQKEIIWEENPPTGKGWSLKSYDLNTNVKSHLIDDGDISNKKPELLSLEFSPDSKEINLEVAISEDVKYFKINLEKNPPTLTKANSPTTTADSVLVSKKTDGDTYSLDKKGNLFKNKEKLNNKPFTIKQETKYDLEVFQDYIFLQEDETLYKFNPDLKQFEKFSESVNNLKLSPSSKILAYLSDYETWLLFLKDKETEPRKKAGEKLLLLRLSEKINDCYWLNDDYLVLSIGDAIKIIEIDDRDKIQTWDLTTLPKPQIFFNQNDKKLYILSDGKLYRSDALLP